MGKVDEFRQKLDKETKSGLISLLVLSTIKETKQPMYGYKIIQTIKELSDDHFHFQEGTVYAILRSLQKQGLLESYIEESPMGPPRKYYRITKVGKEALNEGLKDWDNMIEASMRVFTKLGGR
jgi:PadR family transcriptional regulator PadR